MSSSQPHGETAPLNARGLLPRIRCQQRPYPSRCKADRSGPSPAAIRSSTRSLNRPQLTVIPPPSRAAAPSSPQNCVIFPLTSTDASEPSASAAALSPRLPPGHKPAQTVLHRYVADRAEINDLAELAQLAATARAAEKNLTNTALRDACTDLYTLVAQTAADFALTPRVHGVDACDKGEVVNNKDRGAWDLQIDRATQYCSRPDPDGALSHSERQDDLGDLSDLLDAGSTVVPDRLDMSARYPDSSKRAYRSPSQLTPRAEAAREASALFSDAAPGDALFCPREGCVAFDDNEERMARHILYEHAVHGWDESRSLAHQDLVPDNTDEHYDKKLNNDDYHDYDDRYDSNKCNDRNDDSSSRDVDYGTLLERNDPVLGYFEYANSTSRPTDQLSTHSKRSVIYSTPYWRDFRDTRLTAVATARTAALRVAAANPNGPFKCPVPNCEGVYDEPKLLEAHMHRHVLPLENSYNDPWHPTPCVDWDELKKPEYWRARREVHEHTSQYDTLNTSRGPATLPHPRRSLRKKIVKALRAVVRTNFSRSRWMTTE